MLEGVGEWFWRILNQVGQRTGDGRQQVGKVQQVHIGSAGRQAVHNAQPDCNLLLCIISTVILVVHLFAAGYGNPLPQGKLHFVFWPAPPSPHSHTQLWSFVPAPMPLLLLCLIELAQLFAPPPPPNSNPSLAPSDHSYSLTCCFQMHSMPFL